MKAVSMIVGAAAVASAATIPVCKAPRAAETISREEVFNMPMEPITLEDVKAVLSSQNTTTDDEVSTFDVQAAAVGTCTSNTRVEWKNMTPAQKTNFLNAVDCLMNAPKTGNFQYSSSLYDDLVQAHQSQSAAIHEIELFLPWHRYYVHAYHTLLQDQCGYQGPLPWWDEIHDAGNLANSEVFQADSFGSVRPAAGNGQIQCVNDGKFAGRQTWVGTTQQCLSRELNNDLSAQETQELFNNIRAIQTFEGNSGFEFYMERGHHSLGHRAVGGTMYNAAASPGDPTFFMHHGFVDRQWKIWQNINENRVNTIAGCADKASPCTPLTLDTVLTTKGLVPDVTVAQMMDTQSELLCYTYDSPQ